MIPSTVAKALGPLVIALLVALLTFTRDTPFGGAVGYLVPGLSLLLALLAVVITWRVPNDLAILGGYAKAWANVIHAGAQALLVVLAGGLTFAELTVADFSAVGLAIVGAVATWLVPNAAEQTRTVYSPASVPAPPLAVGEDGAERFPRSST